MFMKHFLGASLFICFINVQLTLGSTLDDVLKAFEELNEFIDNESRRTLAMLIVQEQRQTTLEFEIELNASLIEISNQEESILSKINILFQNAKNHNFSVDHCVTFAKTDLENYVADVKSRLYSECYEVYYLQSDAVWSKFYYLSDTAKLCANMNIVQCDEYVNRTACYDMVLNTIQTIKHNMRVRVDEIQLEVENQGPGLNIVCKQMVTRLMDLYPTLILKYVNSCIDYAVLSVLPPMCSN